MKANKEKAMSKKQAKKTQEHLKGRVQQHPLRGIKTEYRFRNTVIKTTRSADHNRAVAKCLEHMQVNQYGATVAEIFDADTETLYAQVARKSDGSIKVHYERDPRDFVEKSLLAKWEENMKRWRGE
jgi:hypothetical protein